MKAAGWLLLAGIVAASCWAARAQAIPPFKKAFEEKYVNNNANQAFKDAVEKENCFLCHVKAKPKAVRNDYGKALSKILGGNVAKDLASAKGRGGDAGEQAELKKALKALDDAFAKVAAEKSPSGKTYGELIKDGKLPK